MAPVRYDADPLPELTVCTTSNSTPHNSCAFASLPATNHVHFRTRKSIKFAFMCNNKNVVARIGHILPHIYISIFAIRKWISKYLHHRTKPGMKSMFGAKCIRVLCTFLISRHLVASVPTFVSNLYLWCSPFSRSSTSASQTDSHVILPFSLQDIRSIVLDQWMLNIAKWIMRNWKDIWFLEDEFEEIDWIRRTTIDWLKLPSCTFDESISCAESVRGHR